MTRWTAKAEREGTGQMEIVEEAPTYAEVVWLVTSGHEDTKGRPTRVRAGLYRYESPRGKFYTIQKESA